MCLLMYKSKDGVLDYDKLFNARQNNSDGGGFAHVVNGKIVTEKFMNYKDFAEAIKKIEKKQAIIHFRMATSGITNVTNCHPFIVSECDAGVESLDGEIALAHNGVMPEYVKPGKYSDTFHFVKTFAKMYKKGISKKTIESHIGISNKLVTLDKNGVYSIYNESYGHWDNGIWYSNHTYQCYYVPKAYSKYTQYGSYKDYETGYYGENQYGETKYAPVEIIGTEMEVWENCHFVSDTGEFISLKVGTYQLWKVEDSIDDADDDFGGYLDNKLWAY